jgi:hypothetical protein
LSKLQLVDINRSRIRGDICPVYFHFCQRSA